MWGLQRPARSRFRGKAGAAALCVCLSACGSSTGPTPIEDTLPLQAGPQILTFAGAAVSTDPRFPPCTPIGVPRGGTSLDTFVTLSSEGSEWVARSTSAAAGTIELRLRSAGRTVGNYAVTGTVRGTAIDVGFGAPVRDVRVTFAVDGTAATLEGATSSPFSAFVGGRIAGSIRFSDSAGDGSTCGAIQWTMQPR